MITAKEAREITNNQNIIKECEVAIKAAAQEGKSWIFFDCDNHTELIFLMKYLNSNGYKVNHSILHGEFSVSILW